MTEFFESSLSGPASGPRALATQHKAAPSHFQSGNRRTPPLLVLPRRADVDTSIRLLQYFLYENDPVVRRRIMDSQRGKLLQGGLQIFFGRG